LPGRGALDGDDPGAVAWNRCSDDANQHDITPVRLKGFPNSRDGHVAAIIPRMRTLSKPAGMSIVNQAPA